MRFAWGFSEGTSAHPVPSVCAQELHHKNRYWHEDCFRCGKCYKPLASEPFAARDDGKIMCGKCSSREDGNRCQGCYKVVMPGVFAVTLLFLKVLRIFYSTGFLIWALLFYMTTQFLKDWERKCDAIYHEVIVVDLVAYVAKHCQSNLMKHLYTVLMKQIQEGEGH